MSLRLLRGLVGLDGDGKILCGSGQRVGFWWIMTMALTKPGKCS